MTEGNGRKAKDITALDVGRSVRKRAEFSVLGVLGCIHLGRHYIADGGAEPGTEGRERNAPKRNRKHRRAIARRRKR